MVALGHSGLSLRVICVALAVIPEVGMEAAKGMTGPKHPRAHMAHPDWNKALGIWAVARAQGRKVDQKQSPLVSVGPSGHLATGLGEAGVLGPLCLCDVSHNPPGAMCCTSRSAHSICKRALHPTATIIPSSPHRPLPPGASIAPQQTHNSQSQHLKIGHSA